ncbi:MAG: hypothetical protein ACRDIB_15170 [Ardenticatenaceae bacterium]
MLLSVTVAGCGVLSRGEATPSSAVQPEQAVEEPVPCDEIEPTQIESADAGSEPQQKDETKQEEANVETERTTSTPGPSVTGPITPNIGPSISDLPTVEPAEGDRPLEVNPRRQYPRGTPGPCDEK